MKTLLELYSEYESRYGSIDKEQPISTPISSSHSLVRDVNTICTYTKSESFQAHAFRKALRGEAIAPMTVDEAFGFALGTRVREALLYLYEVETDLAETQSAISDRTLHPPELESFRSLGESYRRAISSGGKSFGKTAHRDETS